MVFSLDKGLEIDGICGLIDVVNKFFFYFEDVNIVDVIWCFGVSCCGDLFF